MTVPVRRFERGASIDTMPDFMAKRGYEVSYHGGRYKIKTNTGKTAKLLLGGKRVVISSRYVLVSKNNMIELFDLERMKSGLEPVKARKAG